MQGGPGSQGPSDFYLFDKGLWLCSASWGGGGGLAQGPLPGVMSLGIFYLIFLLSLRPQGSWIGSLQGRCGICVLGNPRSLSLGLLLCCWYPLTVHEVLFTLTPIPSVCLFLSLCECGTLGFTHTRPHPCYHCIPNTKEQASQLVNRKPELSVSHVLRSLIYPG